MYACEFSQALLRVATRLSELSDTLSEGQPTGGRNGHWGIGHDEAGR